jgi:hypothetical protein
MWDILTFEMIKSSKIHTQKINAVYGHKEFLASSSDDASIKVGKF